MLEEVENVKEPSLLYHCHLYYVSLGLPCLLFDAAMLNNPKQDTLLVVLFTVDLWPDQSVSTVNKALEKPKIQNFQLNNLRPTQPTIWLELSSFFNSD